MAIGSTARRRHADLQIAAVAVSNRLPLYTTNADDYPGLERPLTVVAAPRPTGPPDPS